MIHIQEKSSRVFISVPVDKIRVGRDYQAVCPELQPIANRRPDLLADRALLVWSPTVDISEQKCKLNCDFIYLHSLTLYYFLFP